MVARDNVSTTLEAIASTGDITRSGNPGYQLNQPLIISSGVQDNDAKKVSVLGTFMKGPDSQGSCLFANEFGGLAKRIDFGKQTSSSCHVTLEDFSEFKAFCESAS